jgi:hypothetical protein
MKMRNYGTNGGSIRRPQRPGGPTGGLGKNRILRVRKTPKFFPEDARALEVIETVTKSLLVKFDVISLRLWVEIQAAWSERE